MLFNFQGPCRPLSALRFVRRLVYSITLLRFCQVLFSISSKFFLIFFLQKSFLVIASVRQLCYNITLPYPLSTLFFDFFWGFTSCIFSPAFFPVTSIYITICKTGRTACAALPVMICYSVLPSSLFSSLVFTLPYSLSHFLSVLSKGFFIVRRALNSSLPLLSVTLLMSTILFHLIFPST